MRGLELWNMYGPTETTIWSSVFKVESGITGAVPIGRPIPGTRIKPYLPNTAKGATFLGEEQWKWLEEQLRQPADLRLLCSGIHDHKLGVL